MRLKSAKLTHYHGGSTTTVIPIDEVLTIIFEAEGAKADKSEMNGVCLAEGIEQFEISCEFDSLTEKEEPLWARSGNRSVAA